MPHTVSPPLPRAAVAPGAAAPTDLDLLRSRYRAVRARTEALAAPLSPEDAMVQSMEDASPAKWHLAHTTWFFERFVLGAAKGYVPVDPAWDFLFNSYYQSVGPMHARPSRGLVSRPSLDEVRAYRRAVDARMDARFDAGDLDPTARQVITLGTHHEQQHQELLLTDIKHAFWSNPLRPAYRNDLSDVRGTHSALGWVPVDEQVVEIGAPAWPAAAAFAFDSESPVHRHLLQAHALASRPVSNAEYRAFIDDGGYRDPGLWMSEGWSLLQQEGWNRPLYWDEGLDSAFTLGGMRAIDPAAPACHLSYFEADAFARWAGARLPTEFELEFAARRAAPDGNLADRDALHPQSADGDGTRLQQLVGDVWEWTSSAYGAYPGFRSMEGALGEYNGKFMNGQWILRGGSCVTPPDHLRPTYRNFFHPRDRWQFSGVRLARDPA